MSSPPSRQAPREIDGFSLPFRALGKLYDGGGIPDPERNVQSDGFLDRYTTHERSTFYSSLEEPFGRESNALLCAIIATARDLGLS